MRSSTSVALVLGSLTASSGMFLACSSGSSATSSGNGPDGSAPEDGGGQDVTSLETSTDSSTGADSSPAVDSAGQPESGPTDSGSASDVTEASIVCATDAGMTLCSATCTNLQTDTNNCGACGHDCLTGACTAGQCQPIVLANLPSGGTPGQIATDGIYVGFTQTGAGQAAGVFTVKNVGAFQVPVAVDQSANSSYGAPIAMASGNVYYFESTQGDTFMFGATAGTGQSGSSLGNLSTYSGAAVAVDPAGAVVAFGAYQASSNTVAVLSGSVGGTSATIKSSTVDIDGIAGIATDGQNAYYTQTGGLKRVQLLASSVPVSFIGNLGSPAQIVATSGWVYWADNATDYFMRSTTPTALSTNVLDNSASTGCTSLAADSRYIYFTVFAGSSVMYAPVGGGAAAAVLASGMRPSSVAIDSRALYFVDSIAGSVDKVALPL